MLKGRTTHLLKRKVASYNFSSKSENIFSYLQERDLVANISKQDLLSNEESVKALMETSPRMYIGFDPTAESLHLGNLIGIVNAVRFGVFGIEPILLVGGATGQIGDPSGKSKERPLLNKDNVDKNIEGIESTLLNLLKNIEKFPDFKKFCNSRGYSHAYNHSNSSSSDDDEKLIEMKLKKVNDIFMDKTNPYDISYGSFLKTMEIARKTKDKKERKNRVNLSHGNNFSYKIVNNNDFYKDLNIIDFLREVGTNLRMGPLLSRDTVKKRMESSEGISLTEFMYQTFQGYDFLKLYEKFNVKIQIGGSDQWGNMLAGSELIKKVKNSEVINLTFPLMTSSTGQKFGKSEGNALFINPQLTPINSIYQYFFNSSDADLDKLFSYFSFLEKSEIDDILSTHKKKPEARMGQKILSEKLVGLLFNEEEAIKCRKNAEVYYKNFSNVKATETNTDDLELFFKDCQTIKISEDCLAKSNVSTLCVENKIYNTKSEVRRLIQSGSVFINNSKINDDLLIDKSMFLNGKFLILKIGKKHTHIFQINKTESIINAAEISAKVEIPKMPELSSI
jgi:tyrosyl-tRNA synthetase